MSNWQNPVSIAISSLSGVNNTMVGSSPLVFKHALPENLDRNQENIKYMTNIIHRASINLQSFRLNTLSYHFELLALSIMWFGLVRHCYEYMYLFSEWLVQNSHPEAKDDDVQWVNHLVK
jgi:hypothetical protein